MSRRGWTIFLVVLGLSLGLELAVRVLRGSKTCVQIVNQRTVPLTNLSVAFGTTVVTLDDLAPGASAHAWISGSTKGSLFLSYSQSGSSAARLEFPEVDPPEYQRYGFKLVIEVLPTTVMKRMDDELPSSPLGRLKTQLTHWVFGGPNYQF